MLSFFFATTILQGRGARVVLWATGTRYEFILRLGCPLGSDLTMPIICGSSIGIMRDVFYMINRGMNSYFTTHRRIDDEDYKL